eukprot:COSAG01_NODE_6106_length_3848_cov_1.384102_2_plen_182_part_00
MQFGEWGGFVGNLSRILDGYWSALISTTALPPPRGRPPFGLRFPHAAPCRAMTKTEADFKDGGANRYSTPARGECASSSPGPAAAAADGRGGGGGGESFPRVHWVAVPQALRARRVNRRRRRLQLAGAPDHQGCERHVRAAPRVQGGGGQAPALLRSVREGQVGTHRPATGAGGDNGVAKM